LRSGLGALTKAGILAGGVPLALWRLWFVSPMPHHLITTNSFRSLSVWAHLAVLLVAAIWALATFRLVCEIVSALHRREPIEATSWSTRWAVAIAALVVLSTGSTTLVHGPRPTLPSVVASANASKRPVASSTKSPNEGRTTTAVAIGECLADVAARVSGCADDWPSIARSNLGTRQNDGTRMLDPIRLQPGWRLYVPEELVLPAAGESSSSDPVGRLAELALLGLGTVTLVALTRRLRTLRRVNSVTRRDGERRPGNDTSVARAASAIVPFAESPLVDWIDAANRLLWRAVQDGRGSIPEIRLVRAGPEGVEFLLATALRDAPWPFTTRHDGRWWQLDPELDLAELSDLTDGCGRFLSALVPVGDDELASYLVPVGKGRRLSISGDPQCVDAAISSIVIALRCLPWAAELAVELVGIDPPPPEEQCYQLSSSGQGALVDLAHDRANLESRLDSLWRRDPLVVVAGGALASTDEPILERASAVAGVISADERGTEVLEVSKEDAVLHPYGITLKAIAPSRGQLALVEELFQDARRPPEVVAIRPGPERGLDRLADLPAKGKVEVRLLRPLPDVMGLERDLFSRDASRVVELLAYLCLHGMTATIDAIADALFPRSPAPARTARAENAAAAARSALQGVSAHQLLVRRGQNLFLDPSVTCDWLRAERALHAARFAAPERAERLASAAFGLLEGSPFAGIVAGYSWLRAESLDESIAAELVDAAHRLAALFLASGDVARARSAIEKGRLVEPDSEILARDLMAACDAEADRSGVRSTFSELEKALERIGANEPSLETRALFEALDNER